MVKAIKTFGAFLLTLLLLSVVSAKVHAQTNPLKKTFSLTVSNEPVEKVLNKISKKIEANFSYNSDLLPLDSVVSFNLKNVSTARALHILLGRSFYYKMLGKHIIILKRNTVKAESPVKSVCTISGYTYNSFTGEKIPNASIYDVNKNFSALTDSNGFYKLTFYPETQTTSLGFSQSNYNDTVIFIRSSGNTSLDIRMKPKPQRIEKIETKKAEAIPLFDIREYKIVQTFVNAEMLSHSMNLRIYEKRTAQFSILPYIGTNRKVSGAIVNRISINAIAGYSNGLEGAEIGTLLNITKKDVKGFQFSGFGNITGGNTKGFQGAGIFNRNVGNMSGVQMTAFSNIVMDTLKGVQIGCVNYVRTNRGFQLGIINMADSSDGVSIGFVSIVKKGYYNLNLFTDEMLMANLTFKMGTRKFYNIWGLSASPEMWGLTYGFGLHRKPEKKLSLNYDFSVTNMSYKKTFEVQICMKLKFSVEGNYRIGKRMYLFAGPSYNIFASDKIIDTALQNYVEAITLAPVSSTTFKSVKMQHWPGLFAGVRMRL